MRWPVVAVCCVVAFAIAWAVKPGPDVAAAVSQAKRDAGDSATAAVSARYLRDLVAPLRDSLAAYQATPVAAARIVVRRDTVRTVDTVSVQDQTPDSALVRFPDLDTNGVQIRERLVIYPAPLLNTEVYRYLQLSVTPDTVLAALLQLPDGSQRFAALASGQGYAKVVDAAVLPVKHRSWGLGCTGGLTALVTLGGAAYGGLGVSCGLSLRF